MIHDGKGIRIERSKDIVIWSAGQIRGQELLDKVALAVSVAYVGSLPYGSLAMPFELLDIPYLFNSRQCDQLYIDCSFQGFVTRSFYESLRLCQSAACTKASAVGRTILVQSFCHGCAVRPYTLLAILLIEGGDLCLSMIK